jgi:TPR repeat protein
LDPLRNPNYAAALSLYQESRDKAADAEAAFNLGYMHELGLGKKHRSGVPAADLKRARRSYERAQKSSKDA